MAAIAFDSSLSGSTMRPPLASADAPSMADSLPNINFGFDDLRSRMAAFTARFDEFIERGRKRVLEERNQFRMNVAELQEDQRMKKRDVEILSLKAQTHAQTLSKEAAETAEMHSTIASVTAHRDTLLTARDTIKSQITDLQNSINARRSAAQKHALYLDSQSALNIPELTFWEEALGLCIEGVGQEDRLRFVFTHVWERDWERTAWFELDMSSREYRVVRCRPKLEQEGLERCLEILNGGRELAPFLRGMRELFVESTK